MRSAVLLLATFGIVVTEFVLPPINMVVVRGEEMRMNCFVKNNSRVRKWDTFTADHEPVTLHVYSNGKTHPRFNHFVVEVDDNGSEILFTNSTKLNDAGIYKCLSVIDGQDREHSAQLTVLDSIPKCEENFTQNSLNSSKYLLNGDYIWIQCRVSFRGFMTPTIEWIEYGRHLGPDGKIVTLEAELIRIPNRSVTSNIAVNSSRDGSWFACKIYFSKFDGTYNVTAGNVPNFTYIWNSSVITLSPFSSESVSTTTDSLESSTGIRTTRDDIERQSSTDWYLISLSLVAALSLFLIIIVVLVVAFCIRFQRKLSAKYAAGDSWKSEIAVHDGGYDILPYATSDNYDTIDETIIDAGLEVSFAPRKGPLPTPGYSGLTHTDPTAPGVYSRMDNYERPDDMSPGSRDMKVLATMETITEQQIDDNRDMKIAKGEGNEKAVNAYIDLFDVNHDPEDISENHVDASDKKIDGAEEMDLREEENQTPLQPYIELFDVADDSVECRRTSDCEIPSTYLTVNF